MASPQVFLSILFAILLCHGLVGLVQSVLSLGRRGEGFNGQEETNTGTGYQQVEGKKVLIAKGSTVAEASRRIGVT